MKNILFILSVFLFSMCSMNPQNNLDLMAKNDSLERLIVKKDSAMYSIVGTFSAIENNLATIKEKENIITLALKNEQGKSREDEINDDINHIYELMLDNKQKVDNLEKQLKRANVKNNDLLKTVKGLQDKLTKKSEEITQLQQHIIAQNLRIDELNFELDTLMFDNEVKTAIINAQTESLNTAYYIIGSEKELKKMGVLDKKGVFIGIGSGKMLSDNFDKSLFTKIDIQNISELEILAKKARLVSKHPSNSYEFIGKKPVEKLAIKNYEDFWSISKILVIVVN